MKKTCIIPISTSIFYVCKYCKLAGLHGCAYLSEPSLVSYEIGTKNLMSYIVSQFPYYCLFFRHYFAIPTNPGEQFFMFTSLAAWLLRTAGRDFEQPQEV